MNAQQMHRARIVGLLMLLLGLLAAGSVAVRGVLPIG